MRKYPCKYGTLNVRNTYLVEYPSSPGANWILKFLQFETAFHPTI